MQSLCLKALFCIVIIFILSTTLISPIEAELKKNYTQKEINILKKFKGEVKDLINHDWENDDLYLKRWLRAKNFDISQAKLMFAKTQNFRKDNKIDGILNEKELINFQNQLPTAFGEILDKQGRPVYQVAFVTWDLRKEAIAGKIELIKRFTTYSFETMSTKAREVNRSDAVFLVDMFMFNLRQHACIPCLPYYTNFIEIYENHYPGLYNDLILINTPRLFEAVLSLMRPVMSPATKRDLKIFGVDKSEWQPYLLNKIDANQLTPQYGGTKSS